MNLQPPLKHVFFFPQSYSKKVAKPTTIFVFYFSSIFPHSKCELHKRYLPGVPSEGFEQQSGWCPGQYTRLVVLFLPPTEAHHLHPAGTDAAEVYPPDCPYESALAAAGSGTCQARQNAVMVSVSVVPVRQDTMQLWLVSVMYLSNRTQHSRDKCQCGTSQTGHNAVMDIVSLVPVRQDTMQSWLVSVL